MPTESPPDDDAPRGPTGLFSRLVVVMIGLAAALIRGVLGALALAFRRALGAHDEDGPPG